ncbi:MAG: hypothetical protein FWG13_01505 [Leptospirales bacterium]|nr:hypothetical protein [Leptospirales bacterium]
MNVKRNLIVCAILTIMLVCVNNGYAQKYSQNKNQNYFNFGPSGLLAVSDGKTSPGVGLGAGWNNPRLFKDWLGLGAYLNILIPFVEDNVGDTQSGIVASILVGPSTIAFERGAFSLPVTLGYHFDYVASLSQGGDRNVWAINMGIGAAVDAVYQFGISWNVFGRLIAIYNFGDGGEFLLMPAIGAGFKF